MSEKTFHTVSGAIFGLIALLHLGRLFAGWPAHIGTIELPMWLSGVLAVVAAFLAFSAFRLKARR